MDGSPEAWLPWAICLATFAGVMAVSSLFRSRNGASDARLDEMLKTLKSSPSDEASSKKSLLGSSSQILSTPFQPRSQAELEGLRRDLSAAGFQSPSAVPAYATMRLIALVAGGGLANLASAAPMVPSTARPLMLMIGLVVGLYAPVLFMRILIKRRQKRILRALPNMLDLLVISIDAGQALDAALRTIVAKTSRQGQDLCSEMSTFLNQLNMGLSRREALHALGARSGVSELNSFAAVLNQADRFGSSIVDSLRDLSEAIRIRRRHQAEEKAQKAAVKLIFPLVLFIFPGIFTVLVGPAAIGLYHDFCGG